MLNGLDLFSGIGGLSIALERWVVPVAYCESDRYAQAVLLSLMQSGGLNWAPIWDDVQTLDGRMFRRTPIDIIYGGFPCQDISTAGRGAGLGGGRSGLFFEIIRLTRELRPSFIFLENVPAINVRGLDRVLSEFTALGYDTRWTIVSAGEVGAAHLRERWFLVAHSDGKSMRLSKSGQREKKIHASPTLADGKSSYADGSGLAQSRHEERHEQEQPFGLDLLEGNNWDDYASFLRGVDNGIPHRSHRIKALGNSVVPLQAKTAFERLMGFNT